MSLPTAWIDKLFQQMMLTYGDHFLAQYRSAPLAEVKSLWADKLAGFVDFPAGLSFGLENLPADRPPNVLQFRNICRQAPRPQLLQIEAAKADRSVVDAAFAQIVRKVTDGVTKECRADPLGWARALKERHSNGEALGLYQINSYRTALGETA